jgi:hypothetical protein
MSNVMEKYTAMIVSARLSRNRLRTLRKRVKFKVGQRDFKNCWFSQQWKGAFHNYYRRLLTK